MACIPLMQEQLTVCEVWNWLQEKHCARNVPKAEVAGVPLLVTFRASEK
jgi:hypothetical protein